MMLLIADNSLSGPVATTRRAAGAASPLALVPATAATAAENAHDRRDAARRHAPPNLRALEGDAHGATPASAGPTGAPPVAASAPLRAVAVVDGVANHQGAWVEHEFGELIAAQRAYERAVIAARVKRPAIGLVLDGEF